MMAAAAATAGFCDPASVTPPAFPPMDLQAPFRTRSPWRLLVTQGPQTEDYGGNPAPGALDLCLQKNPAEPCIRKPVSAEPPTDAGFTPGWGPHYLEIAKPVYPNGQGGTPLLQLVTASLHAGDGDQLVVTQLLKYDRSRDVFERIYFHSTGTNTNDEVRFIADGPLKGAVISAEPTQNAPYAYWITVNTLTSARTYRQAIRYRSATRYNDGNPLAVIDSEMPNIEQRLGLWRPGTPLPTPRTTPCPKPRLKHMELWCQ
ncbi:MAG: hypothetical protein P4L64_11415 [Caulobacteraceae bacterium]|nr:hypothetical protein [Caulobacteraceae bacterium]